MTSYHAVYQISPMTWNLLGFILAPLLFTFVGVAMVRGWIEFTDKKPHKFAGYFFIGFSLLMEILVIVDSSAKYKDMKRILRDGLYQTVEGRVEDFVPLQDWGNKRESFRVNGIRFSYSDFIEHSMF